MVNAIFVVPYALETTMRFVRAMAAQPGVNLGVLSQEPGERFTRDLGSKLGCYHFVRDPMDVDQLADGVQSIASSWGGRVDRLVGVLEQLQEPLAAVREHFHIRGMSLDEARNFRDKSRMKDLLRENDIPCARHRLARNAAEALAFADECMPLVAKPVDGAGARNTMRIDTRDDLAGYLRTIPPTKAMPLLLEEFILGEEHSFDSVSLAGKHVFHSISNYTPTPLEVMENPWIQWSVVLPREIEGDEFEDIRTVGSRALDALGMHTGLTHMEWFRRPDGSLAISEVAARPPGAQFTTLLSYAYDLDFYAAWTRLMAFEEFDVPERKWAVGAVYLRGQGDGQVQAVHGVEAAQRELGDLVVQAKLPRPGQPRADSYEGEGFVILRHAETERVEAGLRRLLELIHVELS